MKHVRTFTCYENSSIGVHWGFHERAENLQKNVCSQRGFSGKTYHSSKIIFVFFLIESLVPFIRTLNRSVTNIRSIPSVKQLRTLLLFIFHFPTIFHKGKENV